MPFPALPNSTTLPITLYKEYKMTAQIREIQLQLTCYRIALERGYITALEFRELTQLLDLEMQKITETFRRGTQTVA